MNTGGGGLGPRRRVRAVVAGGQALEELRDRDGDPVLPAVRWTRNSTSLPEEVLLVVAKNEAAPSGSSAVVCDSTAVDPQRQLDRLRAGRPRAAGDRVDDVVGVDRDAVLRVQRVGQAQAR